MHAKRAVTQLAQGRCSSPVVSGTTGGPKSGCGRLRRSFVDNSDWSNFRRKLFIHIIQHSTHTGRSSS
ncbi:hypothetical protein OPV22_035073 [Ensete ventricosum]|uniref:Uncharacterized protein n=1 Tax=Ensete ventricosum TaxID=4639 RepID=A0AAX5NGW6_ENSVE|nr:hypothetical protein OPV22_035073 [Ensete ventricosum]